LLLSPTLGPSVTNRLTERIAARCGPQRKKPRTSRTGDERALHACEEMPHSDYAKLYVLWFSMTSSTVAYYDATAEAYDDLHAGAKDLEHIRALERGWKLLNRDIQSVLDVGCGTGRTLGWFAAPKLFGIDPSVRLLEIAARKRPDLRLSVGTGEHLPFADQSVDLVVATGIMHHVDHPDRVIAEMFRVARVAVLISDHNNFAFGSPLAKRIRLALWALGLLGLATFVKQGFRRQGYSEDDGWWYPYSLLRDHGVIARHASETIYFPTGPNRGDDLLTGQSHLAVLAMK
jgi:SAM-dependent methyltransferase